jgi:hypothetical protein
MRDVLHVTYDCSTSGHLGVCFCLCGGTRRLFYIDLYNSLSLGALLVMLLSYSGEYGGECAYEMQFAINSQ